MSNPQTSRSSRPPGLGNLARVGIFAAATVLLVGVALAAGGLGPWVARPISGPVNPPPRITLTPPSRPTASQPAREAPESPGSDAVGWGIRIVVVAILAILTIVIVRWIYSRFRDFAGRGDPGTGVPMMSDLAGVQQPPPVLEQEAGRNFDPRQAADAIISCWLWVERAAAANGSAKRTHDTPTEFLDRFVLEADGGAQARAAAETLLPLYQRARFDHVALTADAATEARAAAAVLCTPIRRSGTFVDESTAGAVDRSVADGQNGGSS